MKHYALIGNPLGHSWSQRLFEEAVPHDMADYQLCEMTSLDGLRQWVSDNDISGFNVTLPYKEAILPYLDTLTSEAKEIGAVNCVKVMDGKLIGYNTDAPAFRHTLEDTLSTLHSPLSTLHSAFILGTGGAARAVAYALSQIGINYTFVSRHPELHPNSIGYNQIIQTIKQSSNPTRQRHPRRHLAQRRRHTIRLHSRIYEFTHSHINTLRPDLQPIPHPAHASGCRQGGKSSRWTSHVAPTGQTKPRHFLCRQHGISAYCKIIAKIILPYRKLFVLLHPLSKERELL